MRTIQILSFIGLLLGLDAPWILQAAAALNSSLEQVIQLRETSIFKYYGNHAGFDDFLRGQYSDARYRPDTNGVTYPAFKSTKPIYGSVRFGMSSADLSSGTLYYYALDESAGTGQGYDLFYIDRNHDLNLANEPPLKAQTSPPGRARSPNYAQVKREVCFQYLTMDFDYGETTPHSLEIMPRLIIFEPDFPRINFVCLKLFQGKLTVENESFQVLLGQDYFITGRFDQPGTALRLQPINLPNFRPSWLGDDRLMAIHQFGQNFCRFTASPTGERLTVRRYEGDWGTFALGPGSRSITKFTMRGSLQAKDKAVAIGGKQVRGGEDGVPSCQVPVGEYLPSYLSLEYGHLQIALSQNYHSEGKARDRLDRLPIYGFQITKDKPFILDFSHKPIVMFTSPAPEDHIVLGRQIKISAVLVDPQLDIMIRCINDNSRQETKSMDLPNGTTHTYQRPLSLDPKILVTRLNGEKVTEGIMPFG